MMDRKRIRRRITRTRKSGGIRAGISVWIIRCVIRRYFHLLFVYFSEACDVRNAGLGYDTTKIT